MRVGQPDPIRAGRQGHTADAPRRALGQALPQGPEERDKDAAKTKATQAGRFCQVLTETRSSRSAWGHGQEMACLHGRGPHTGTLGRLPA